MKENEPAVKTHDIKVEKQTDVITLSNDSSQNLVTKFFQNFIIIYFKSKNQIINVGVYFRLLLGKLCHSSDRHSISMTSTQKQ